MQVNPYLVPSHAVPGVRALQLADRSKGPVPRGSGRVAP